MNKYKIESEDGEGSTWSTTGFVIESEEDVSKHYLFFIEGPILSISQYTDVFSVLRKATEDDVVELSVTSGGGDLFVAEVFSNELARCEAHIHFVVDAELASGATTWLMRADSYEIDDNASFLFHESAYSVPRVASSDVVDYVKHSEVVGTGWLTKYYSEFFTEEEMNKVKKGYQMHLTGKQVKERLDLLQQENNKKKEEIDSQLKEFETQQTLSELGYNDLKGLLKAAQQEVKKRKELQ